MKTEIKLERLKKKAREDVDIDKLVDIRNVHIDKKLPAEKRMQEFIKQIKNPYVYKCGDTVVRVKFTGTETLDACLGHELSGETFQSVC
jgi:hypothetical protein